MLPWFEEMLPKLPRGSNTAEAIRYTLNHWKGLIRFLDDGRIELDNNTVERSIRPITLQRKNALFTGHDLRSEEHTSELQSLMRISYAVFCLKKNKHTTTATERTYKYT